jgi:hypothetical protein
MTRASFTSITTVVLVGIVCPVARAAPDEAQEAVGNDDAEEDPGRDAPAPPASVEELGRDAPAPPASAEEALVRAAAAYEYGDMNQVVEAARPVTEGLLTATPPQEARAFRLLGIGLYLTNRQAGAETAFKELLRREPFARLDPTTTRPEVVAFLDSLRRQQVTDQRRFIWNFIPPVGQFQNGDRTKGWIILGVGVTGFAAMVTSKFLPMRWKTDGDQYPGHYDAAHALKVVSYVSAGVLGATYLYGVIDGLVGYSRPLDEGKSRLSLKLFPQGAGVELTF